MLFVGALCGGGPPLDRNMYLVEIHRGMIGNGIDDVDGRDYGEIWIEVSI